ncbi:hypothetical protein OG921_20795 [Aldersonia sp. NBC_00410]|uniref:hypothetical protein n=1 Tax=Aldersonia sp. NBC_00410 TaxID=2975954 RepID=UPI002254A1EC|nr:hypothetical protein [Aldersonia sp. NBC_00410]MCX5045607.1 hypothetical protein [Aldersonia sp. NBC_00410]
MSDGPPPPTSRLGVIDEMFLRSHRGFGTPIALQGLWRTDGPVDRAVLEHVHERLRTGALGRSVVRPWIPGARAYWIDAGNAHPLDSVEEPIAAEEISSFAQTNLPDLDPTKGPGWHVRTAPVEDGGALVALTCSHALCDARGLIDAVDRALAGQPEPRLGEPGSDWKDARRTWQRIATGTTLRSGSSGGKQLPATFNKRGPARTAIIACDGTEWDEAAAANGGTPNSLFVATMVRVLARAAGSDEPHGVALPISLRDSEIEGNGRSHETGGNAMTMGSAAISAGDDLDTVVQRCRAAYAAPLGSPPGRPAEWLHVLPDRLAHAAAHGAGERDVLCSNIGALPDSVAALGPHRATGLATRAIHPGLDARRLGTLRTRLSGYLSLLRGTYTLSLLSFDAEFVADAHLRELALTELARLGVAGSPW